MSGNMVFLLIAGGAVGLGVVLLLRALAPVQTDLADGLARLDSSALMAEHTGLVRLGAVEDPSALTRLFIAVSHRLGRLRITTPDADLQILGMTREQYVGLRVLASLAALALGPLLTALVWVAGFSLPVVFSVVESLLLAAVIWWYVGRAIAGRAEDARREMRYALVSYINVVALYRAAGTGIVSALHEAATVSGSWAYRQITRQLAYSERAGHQPWEGLADLARTLDIKELADIGSIASVSGVEGGAVFDTLLARARSLRSQLLTDEKTEAAEASTKLTYPQTMLAAVVMVFLLFPAMMRLLGG